MVDGPAPDEPLGEISVPLGMPGGDVTPDDLSDWLTDPAFVDEAVVGQTGAGHHDDHWIYPHEDDAVLGEHDLDIHGAAARIHSADLPDGIRSALEDIRSDELAPSDVSRGRSSDGTSFGWSDPMAAGSGDPPPISLTEDEAAMASDSFSGWPREPEHGILAPEPVIEVLRALTGNGLEVDALTSTTADLGLFGAEDGAGLECRSAVGLLDHFGVDARVEHGDLPLLRALLGQGCRVLLTGERERGGPSAALTIALELHTIDDARGVAVLASTGGTPVEVPLGDLLRWWDETANEMLVADAAGAAEMVVLPVLAPATTAAR